MKKVNVLIPCAGRGSRFQEAGYTFPKPLIEVNGVPMIELVVNNLNLDGHHIFLVQEEHYLKYHLADFFPNIVSKQDRVTTIIVDTVMEGAARHALFAKDLINNDTPLIIANSDQYVEWDSADFLDYMEKQNADGGIVTFFATHPKWSFAKIDPITFYVSEVAEKIPISTHATVGIYYWRKGSDFVKYAEQMMKKDIRTNGEFYICPVFNEAIQDGKLIVQYNVKHMWGLGTPEDLTTFLTSGPK